MSTTSTPSTPVHFVHKPPRARKALAFALALPLLLAPAFPARADSPEQQAYAEAIDDLLEAIDPGSAAEDARLGATDAGYLTYFGTADDSGAETDDSKSGVVAKALEFLTHNGGAFGVKSAAAAHVTFDLIRTTEANYHTYVRAQQYYDDVPVFCGEAVVQVNENDQVDALLADLMNNTDDFDDESKSVDPTLTSSEAEAAAIDAMVEVYQDIAEEQEIELTQQDIDDFENDLVVPENPELVVYDPDIVDMEGSTCLAWKVLVTGEELLKGTDVVLIDAATGDTVLVYSLTSTALDRQIWDQDNDAEETPVLVREEGDPPCDITDADLAYQYFGYVYDFYSTYHDRDGIDGNGMTIVATVNYCPPLSGIVSRLKNECPYENAGWDPTINEMVFGQGFVCDDIIGHELTHGVTSYESALSGNVGLAAAVNESFSDIWGEFTDLTHGGDILDPPEHVDDDTEFRWTIGEDYPGGVIRKMADPLSNGDPDRIDSEYFEDPPYSIFEVQTSGSHSHKNAGVNDRLASLLTDGSGGYVYGRTVSAMGIGKVAKLYYECQTNLLTSASGYYALYYALQQAAVNLAALPAPYTFTTADRENVRQACCAVDMRPTAFVSMRDTNGDRSIQFTDMGDLILWKGTIHEEAVGDAPTGVPRIILQDSVNGNLAVFCPDSGDLYLKGAVHENLAALYLALVLELSPCAVIRQQQDRPVAIIDSDGTLSLAGSVIAP